jgi:hypothetical protein
MLSNTQNQETAAHDTATRRRRAARLITEVFHPGPLAAVLLIAVAVRNSSDMGDLVKWAVVGILFAAVLPMLYVLRGVRRGRFSDHHVPNREQRIVPLLIAAFSVLFGLALMIIMGAPRDLIRLVVAMAIGLIAVTPITRLWKISIHTAVASGTVATLAFLFSPALLVLSPIVGLVAWARVELRDHTRAQVIGGATFGAAVAATTFSLIR